METLADPRHQRLLEWLTTVREDRDPPHKHQLADELGVHIRTLRDWEVKPEFIAAHEERARRIVGSVERTKAVLDAMHAEALDRNSRKQIQAAVAYLKAVEYIKPQKQDAEKKDARELTDEELAQLAAMKAADEIQARGMRVITGAQNDNHRQAG